MVDFSKFVPKASTVQPADPLALFQTLDRKASHVTLRNAQQEVLSAWHARRLEHDHVLKMPTGTGKSAVGLLYLWSHMVASRKPGLYLCPTVQLVEQVLAEAAQLGIDAWHYPRNERYPDPRCVAAEAVIVCTYDKLFNAKSTFDRADVMLSVGAIVLDDAHSGAEEIRDAFTVRCSEPALLAKVQPLLAPAARAYSPGQWDDITTGRPDATMEIPYWSWSGITPTVRAALAANADASSFKFAWGHVADSLRWCRCVLDANGLEIAPLVPLVDRVRVYRTAPHRLFMSATLADDSILARELGCEASAVRTPIIPTSDGGLGERMVLSPSLLSPKLTRPWLIDWCRVFSQKHNVVALCSSERQAADWAAAGARVAAGDDVAVAVRDLKAGKLKFAAFAQRYDGVDLADDACRILVIDGVPFGQGIIDRHDSAQLDSPGGVRSRTITRIEQGMGRAVRSNADYAVVILGGPDLAAFTARRDVQDRMSVDVRLQSDLARVLADMAKQEPLADPDASFGDLVRKCLTRDVHWKSFYDSRVRKTAAAAASVATDERAAIMGTAEHQAVRAAVDGDPLRGYQILDEALTKAALGDAAKAPYLQLLGNLSFDASPAESGKLQASAYSRNRSVLRPPAGFTPKPVDPARWEVASKVLGVYAEYADSNGLVALFQSLKPQLAFAIPAKKFEAAFASAARIMGVESSRPDHEGTLGPDNLLMWPDLSLIIEAKNEANYSTIPKGDAEQLLHSVEWFKDAYPTRTFVPVAIGPARKAAKGVMLPAGTKVMTKDLLAAFVGALENFVIAVASKPSSVWTVREVDALLDQHGLSAAKFVGRFTVTAG